MFDKTFLDELADAISERISKKQPDRHDWPAVMSIETAAEYIDRSVQALRNLHRFGQIPAVRADRSMQFRRVDLDEWAARSVERIA
jgi:excisionase family DNA binding protein